MNVFKVPCAAAVLAITPVAAPIISLAPMTAYAHHGSAPHFDHDQSVTVSGKITELKLVNPHSYLYFDVEQDGEIVNWRCELSSALQHIRQGWTKEMFAPGRMITVTGSPARREENVCLYQSMTFDDGEQLGRRDVLSTAKVDTILTETGDRPLRLADGTPNLKGPWLTLSFGRRNPYVITPEYEPTPAGEKAAEGYDSAFDDPILRCHYVNLINGWMHDENINDIYQDGKNITMQYGFMDVKRTIHMDMKEHPEMIVPNATGHSIGHWDGDTLVIDTVGFEPGVLAHQTGTQHSDQLHVVERIHFDTNKSQLVRDYTLTDPLYLANIAVGRDYSGLVARDYSPFNCTELSGENNIRPEPVGTTKNPVTTRSDGASYDDSKGSSLIIGVLLALLALFGSFLIIRKKGKS